MQDFNRVFSIIKKHCSEMSSFGELDCYERVALEANIPIEKLELYLGILKDLGIIQYNEKEKSIRLTPFGQQQNKIVDN